MTRHDLTVSYGPRACRPGPRWAGLDRRATRWGGDETMLAPQTFSEDAMRLGEMSALQFEDHRGVLPADGGIAASEWEVARWAAEWPVIAKSWPGASHDLAQSCWLTGFWGRPVAVRSACPECFGFGVDPDPSDLCLEMDGDASNPCPACLGAG